MMLVADEAVPSAWTPVCLIVQRSPSRLQRPSPNPPAESNSHERIWRASGSQPMRWEMDITGLPSRFTVTSRSRKFPPSAQRQESRTEASGRSSTHSPTIHSRSLSRS